MVTSPGLWNFPQKTLGLAYVHESPPRLQSVLLFSCSCVIALSLSTYLRILYFSLLFSVARLVRCNQEKVKNRRKPNRTESQRQRRGCRMSDGRSSPYAAVDLRWGRQSATKNGSEGAYTCTFQSSPFLLMLGNCAQPESTEHSRQSD